MATTYSDQVPAGADPSVTDQILGSGSGEALAYKAPCRVATTTNITLSGTQTIDGVLVAVGDRVLVKDQTTASQNGIYVVSSSTWSRSRDFNSNRDVTKGTRTSVIEGTVAAGFEYRVTTANPIAIDTSDIAWARADLVAQAGAEADDAAASAAAALASQTAAATSATNAANSATAAATSATNASNSATAAQTAETAAELAETNAETAETNAAASASAAATSATNASNSATAAATSETNAANSATAASTSATNAANSATAADTSADAAAISEANAAASAATASALAASEIHGATEKTTPVDADEFGMADSAASWVMKKVTWANIKATIRTYLLGTVNVWTVAQYFTSQIGVRASAGANGHIYLQDESGVAQGLLYWNRSDDTVRLRAYDDASASRSEIVLGGDSVSFTFNGVDVALLSGTQTLSGKTLVDPAITGAILEDIFTITDAAGFSIDPGNGSIQLITLGANRTPVATNFTNGESVTLMVNDGSAFTITWTTAAVTWVGGSAPTLATSGYTVIELWKVGGTLYGAHVGDVA